MKKNFLVVDKRTTFSLISWILILLGLYLTSLYSYLLFHSLAEMFSIVVACGIFMLAWNVRRFLDHTYLLFLGVAYLFIGGLDMLHTLAYKGMGVFQAYNTNLPTQLWIAARYEESLSLFIALFFIRRKLKLNMLFFSYALATSLLLGSIFYWELFPICFIEGVGLTGFKKVSEYAICLILLAAVAMLYRKRREFDGSVLRLLIASVTLTIVAELSFTFYMHAYGFSNLIGHFFKIISFYLIYKAVIETGLARPYTLLFRNLKRSEEALQQAHDELEQRVEERTAQLRQEIKDRKRVEKALRESKNQLHHLSSQLLSAQENERKSVAQDLHDSIGQTLAAIKFGTERTLAQLEKKAPKKIIDPLESVVSMIQNAIQEVRRIQTNLRPPTLDDLGIVATISWFCREFQTIYSGIRIQQRVDVHESEVPDPLKTIIYRVMQEALSNIAKHSKADRVFLSLEKAGGKIKLAIEDNGIGLEEKPSPQSSERGIGLSSMRERVELSGGSFTIEPAPGRGTLIRAAWPEIEGIGVFDLTKEVPRASG